MRRDPFLGLGAKLGGGEGRYHGQQGEGMMKRDLLA